VGFHIHQLIDRSIYLGFWLLMWDSIYTDQSIDLGFWSPMCDCSSWLFSSSPLHMYAYIYIFMYLYSPTHPNTHTHTHTITFMCNFHSCVYEEFRLARKKPPDRS
jgi:hypothetical protein